MKKIQRTFLITGSAGFIGFHLSKKLLDIGHLVYGIDNFDDYYDINLKKKRNNILKKYNNYFFNKFDIKNIQKLTPKNIDIVIHLAAQPGIKLSEFDRDKYFSNNISNTFKLIEFMTKNKIKKIIYASSSSVYSGNKKVLNNENDKLKLEKNFYATTKKINETLISYYFHKNISSVGIRFFTVFGPYGRPDMLMSKIMDAYKNNSTIFLFNNGVNRRDFTFIDDSIDATMSIINSFLKNKTPYLDVFNIGFGKPIKVNDIISIFEKKLNYKFKKKLVSSNNYENVSTCSSSKKFFDKFGLLKPTKIEDGINEYIHWYKKYYKIN